MQVLNDLGIKPLQSSMFAKSPQRTMQSRTVTYSSSSSSQSPLKGRYQSILQADHSHDVDLAGELNSLAESYSSELS